MSANSPISKVATLTVQQLQSRAKAEKEIEALYKQLQENENLENELSEVLPSTKERMKEMNEKDAIIREKQKQLIELQNFLLSTKTTKKEMQSLEPVPIITNRIQDLVCKLSEQAIDEKTTAVPILSILKVYNALNELYKQCADFGYINESKEMIEKRAREFENAQQSIVDKLKKHVSDE